MVEETLAIPSAQREARDASARFITIAFLLLVSGITIIGLLCWWLFPRAPHHNLLPAPPPAYPAPRLQASPHEDMVRFYREEMDRLNSVGWVDRAKGLVHVPIDQAMHMIAKDGIKDWPKPPPGAPSGQAPAAPSGQARP
ncbi:MAG: hypothetical protein ABI224_03175 [Acetobacteraceae bacterium]